MTLMSGFAEPVFDAQAVFRTVLTALAEPGRMLTLPVRPAAPAPLSEGAAALLLALADGETPLWLDAPLRLPAIAEHLRFHCGAPLVDAPADAVFAVLADPAAMPPPAAFAQGSEVCPESAATLILQVPALEGGPRLTLRGPGIPSSRPFAVAGLPAAFAGWLADNLAGFPCGVDLLFTDGRRLLGLPRTTRIGE